MLFNSLCVGTSVVRAYQAQDRFILENCKRVNENNIYYFSGTVVAARWLGIRLEFLGAIIVFAASLLTVLSRDSLQSGLVGLAVSSSLSVTCKFAICIQRAPLPRARFSTLNRYRTDGVGSRTSSRLS